MIWALMWPNRTSNFPRLAAYENMIYWYAWVKLFPWYRLSYFLGIQILWKRRCLALESIVSWMLL